MLSYFKTGICLIVIGLLTIITTYPSTQGFAFFFVTLLSMILIVIGLVQFWIDGESHQHQRK